MPSTLITTAILSGLELALNHVLKLDPSSQQAIGDLDGSTLVITSLSPSFEFFLLIQGRGIRLCSYYEGKTDVEIVGQAKSLLNLLLSHDKTQAFYSNGIEIKGNLELAQNLQEILSKLEIDWEYHLSKFIGDIPTQALKTGLNSSKELATATHNSLLADIDEYIHEEKKLFPSSNELESFYSSIDLLRFNVDRVNAKLENLALKYS